MIDNKSDDLKRLRNVEHEILDLIVSICVKYNLKYSLAYGTLIGAVRHMGFIPWDDDIDIQMPRDDYERFLQIWDELQPEGYILVNHRLNPDFTQNFSKIRKDHTIFLQTEKELNLNYHKGIFVDIFPVDRVAPKGVLRTTQYGMAAIHLLYTRGHASTPQGGSLLERALLSLPKKYYPNLSLRTENFLRKWNARHNLLNVCFCTIGSAKIYYPADMFDSLIEMKFENKEYKCFKNYDQILRADYGDYMKLPPIDERVYKHTTLMLDFEHNLDEIIAEGCE